MRTRKSIYNFIADVFPQLVIAVLSFFRIKLFLDYIGTEKLGVYQLFAQVLPYLSLAEMGITSAVTYSLYRPISERNKKKISQILVGTRKIFNRIMIFMIVVGFIIAPNVKFLIAETELSNFYIMFMFIIAMLANLISYVSTPYVALFDANQEQYKYNFFTQIVLVIKQVVEIVLIVVTKNLFIVLVSELLFSIVRIIIIKKLFNKNYDYVDFNEKEDTSFLKKTKELFPHKIGTLVSRNIDVVITSKFLGLTSVVSYNSYYYIINVINGIIGKFSSATLASLGNLLVEAKERAYKVFLEYNSMLFFVATIICIPLSFAISPFVQLWYGNEFVVDNITVIFFTLIMFYEIIRIVLNTFCGAAGIYKETIKCTYIEIVVNLVLSLILVNYLGIKGLLIGTFISLIVSEYFIKPNILNIKIFEDQLSKYYLQCLKLFLVALINSLMLRFIYNMFSITNLLWWFIYSFLIFVINFIITIGLYKLLNEFEFVKRIKK